jgi:hypothetical protein
VYTTELLANRSCRFRHRCRASIANRDFGRELRVNYRKVMEPDAAALGSGGVSSVRGAWRFLGAFPCQIYGAGALYQHQVGMLLREMADSTLHARRTPL